jgi:hypothetical protein
MNGIVMHYRTGTKNRNAGAQDRAGRLIRLLTLGLLSVGLVTMASAGPREQAKRIHDRLAGVPPTEAVLSLMEGQVSGATGTATDAALEAMKNPNFYNVTLKNFAAPWTNRDQNVFVPLNDYIATVIGMIRDGEAFNTLFSADILYIGPASLPPYSNANNNHYDQMESRGVDMMTELQKVTQSTFNGLPTGATAGIWTTRAAAEAFFIAGTNRAQFRFTMLNHMCNDMEQVHDVKRVPDRIRQDVSRSPGGDSRLFLNNCIGCHSGMDPMAGAFAYYNFDEVSGIEYTPNTVQPKYFNNDANFEFGYRTTDDSWANYWRNGQNQFLGWDAMLPGSGFGAASMGQELANSDAFASCQVKKVFRAVCLRDPEDAADRFQVDNVMVPSFKAGYQMKQTFAEAAVYCMGQ